MIENVSTQPTVFHCLCPLPASLKGLRLLLRSALFGEGGRDWRPCTTACQWLGNVDMHLYANCDQNIPCGSRVMNIFTNGYRRTLLQMDSCWVLSMLEQEMSQTRDECPQRNWSSTRHI